jgi:hypothetical protein
LIKLDQRRDRRAVPCIADVSPPVGGDDGQTDELAFGVVGMRGRDPVTPGGCSRFSGWGEDGLLRLSAVVGRGISSFSTKW